MYKVILLIELYNWRDCRRRKHTIIVCPCVSKMLCSYIAAPHSTFVFGIYIYIYEESQCVKLTVSKHIHNVFITIVYLEMYSSATKRNNQSTFCLLYGLWCMYIIQCHAWIRCHVSDSVQYIYIFSLSLLLYLGVCLCVSRMVTYGPQYMTYIILCSTQRHSNWWAWSLLATENEAYKNRRNAVSETKWIRTI